MTSEEFLVLMVGATLWTHIFIGDPDPILGVCFLVYLAYKYHKERT